MKKSPFQFVSPYLLDLKFNLNPNFDFKNEQIEMKNNFKIEVKGETGENRANVQLTLDSNIDSDDDVPFKLHITVASDFIWDDLDDKTVDNMLNVNAPALLLSYMRPIVANITNVSNLPAYNLPFINFKN